MALEELYVPQAGDDAELASLAALAGEAPDVAETPEAEPAPEGLPDAQQQPVESSATETDHEAEARQLGWVPKEEYKADPKFWKPAKEFLEYRGTRISSLRRELEETKAATAKLFLEQKRQREAETQRSIREFEAQRAAYEARIASLQDTKWSALEEGDIAKARLAEAELMRSRPPAPPAPPQVQQLDMSPEAVAYRAAVDQAHPDAKDIATSDEFHLWLVGQDPLLRSAWNRPDPRYGIEVLKRFKADTGRTQKPAAPPKSPVAAPRGAPPRPQTSQAFSSLPEQDRKDFNYMVRLGVYKDTDADKSAFAKAWAESRKG